MDDDYKLPELEEIPELDKEALTCDNIFLSVFEIADAILRTRYFTAMKARAKELKCATEMNSLIKAFAQESHKVAVANATDMLSIGGYGEFKLGAWAVDKSEKIVSLSLFGEVVACYHLIIPVRRFVNLETNEEMVVLAYKRKDDVWREITVKRSVIASASKIVDLASKGIAVTSENARNLVKFLADFENLNYDLIPISNSTSKMGWKNGKFIPFERNDIVFDGEAKNRATYDALEPRGSFDEWKEYMTAIRKEGKFENLIYLAGSFASVLVGPLGCLPFVLDIYGPSGRGKTVSLMMATSVWANPKDGEYIQGANSTDTALEVKLDFLNDLPLCVDDLAQMRLYRGQDFSDFIYRVCSGRGKSRSNVTLSVDNLKSWHNVTLTNAERPLCSDSMKGGAVNRIIDVAIGDEPMFTDGNKAADFFRKHYGHAGPMFIKAINELGIDKIKDIFKHYQEKIIKKSQETEEEKESKQILPMALLLTADAISDKFIFCDGCRLDFDKCFETMKGINEVSENERAWEFLINTIAMNMSKFDKFRDEGVDQATSQVTWGHFRKGQCFLNKTAYNDILAGEGFAPDSVLKWAASTNKVETFTENNGKKRFTCPKKVQGKTIRHVAIYFDDTSDEFIEVSKEEQENLPFL